MEKVKKNKKLEKHLTSLWTLREDWCLSYRSGILTRGNNTNNYCESSIRIFKDVVLQRYKVFNMCALVDFIANTFESYHKKRLIQFANGRARNLTLAYEKFCQASSRIHMDAPRHCAMTFDLWTDQYRKLNCITFTLHYLTAGRQFS